MRICVMGAGVGGLTAAHKLIRMGHKVDVFERNPIGGGLARTRYLKNGEHSEYCWHAFMNTYTSLIPIMKEIPFKGSTVADQLKPVAKFAFGCSNDKFRIEHVNPVLASFSPRSYSKFITKLGYKFTNKDLWKIAMFKLFVSLSTPERFDQHYYDTVSWAELMDSLSPDAKTWMVDLLGVFLGLEPDRTNTHAILHLVRESYRLQGFGESYRKKYGVLPMYYSLNGPTNEQWFDPWVKYLMEKGVSINFENKISKILCEEGEVKEITVSNGKGESNLSYDVYVNGLDVQSFGNLLCGANGTKEKMMGLNNSSYQIQPQIAFSLTEKVHFGEKTLITFQDTAWMVMCRPEGAFWDIPLGKNKNPPGELLSVGIGSWHTKGILYGKTARKCTEEELVNEVWAQMKGCTGLMKHYKTDNNGSLEDVHYTSYNVWYSFSYDQKSGEFDTWEPKFSNNVGTLALRPYTQQPDIKNLLHANAYTRTDANIFNMDGAAEAGIRAANYIQFKEARPDSVKYIPPKMFWRFCHNLDRTLLNRGYSNPVEMLLRC